MRAVEKARVQGGRLQLDMATTLPDGTEIEVEIQDSAEDLDPAEADELRRRLAEVRAGCEMIDNDDVMRALEEIDAGAE